GAFARRCHCADGLSDSAAPSGNRTIGGACRKRLSLCARDPITRWSRPSRAATGSTDSQSIQFPFGVASKNGPCAMAQSQNLPGYALLAYECLAPPALRMVLPGATFSAHFRYGCSASQPGEIVCGSGPL